jgi:ankyrin repeat protein
MTSRRYKRSGVVFLGLLALLIAVPVGLTWSAVRQARLNQALIAAVRRNDDRAAVMLLNLGADANCQDEPLGQSSLWQTLMQIMRGKRQRSLAPPPLLIALGIGKYLLQPELSQSPDENVSLVRALLNHGAKVNGTDKSGVTPLMWAIYDGKNATTCLLIKHGANVHIHGTGNDLIAPLVEAARNPQIKPAVIADMLDHGADVNQRDFQGDTALTSALGTGDADLARLVEVVRLLLDRRADVTVCSGGMLFNSPLRMAQRGAMYDEAPQWRQIVRLLKAAGAKQ